MNKGEQEEIGYAPKIPRISVSYLIFNIVATALSWIFVTYQFFSMPKGNLFYWAALFIFLEILFLYMIYIIYTTFTVIMSDELIISGLVPFRKVFPISDSMAYIRGPMIDIFYQKQKIIVNSYVFIDRKNFYAFFIRKFPNLRNGFGGSD